MARKASNLTYEEWLKHLEEKEREKRPPTKKERVDFLIELLDRFGGLF